MGTTKTMSRVVGVVVCLAGGFAVYGIREGSVARAEKTAALEVNRVLAQEIRRANSQLDEVARRKRQADEACAAARKGTEELAALKVTPAAVAAKAGEKANVMDARQVRMQLLRTNPEYQSAMIEMQRLELSSKYGALYKKQSLTPQQIERFEEAVVAHFKAGYEIRTATFAQWIGSSRENDPARETACQPKIKEEQTQFWGKVREVLGESGYREFTANYAHEAASAATKQLVQDLYYSATPLTVTQADAVIVLLSKNFLNQNFDWTAVFAQAPGVLAEPQIAVFKQRVEVGLLHKKLWDFVAKAAATSPQGTSL